MYNKSCYLVMICLCLFTTIKAQKPVLDLENSKKWTGLSNGTITADGKYVFYTIINQPGNLRTIVIQSTSTEWKKEIKGASAAVFDDQSRFLVFKSFDSLWILNLAQDKLEPVSAVESFSLANNHIVYRKRSNSSDLEVYSLLTGKEVNYSSVKNYGPSSDGNKLVLELTEGDKNILKVVDLVNGRSVTVWSSSELRPTIWCWNSNSDQMAFITERKTDSTSVNQIWTYNTSLEKTTLIATDQSEGIDRGLVISSRRLDFSGNDRIIFYLQDTSQFRPDPNVIKVDVWSYTDRELQSKQLTETAKKQFYAAIAYVKGKYILRLEQSNDKMITENGDFAIMQVRFGSLEGFEKGWNRLSPIRYTLVSLKDGVRKILPQTIGPSEYYLLSPSGKWILKYNLRDHNYYSYEIEADKWTNITRGAGINWLSKTNDYAEPRTAGFGAWLPGENEVFVYDNNDIWRVDLTGKRPPQNWTNGYGKRNHLKITMYSFAGTITEQLNKENQLLIRCFDPIYKKHGFLLKDLSSKKDPELLSLGSYLYGDYYLDAYASAPIKAKNASVYYVRRQNATEYPNIFITKDFRNFRQLSDIHPEKDYNWLTAELFSWKSLDGQMLQGVLYKPEDFDSTKKYPIIFDYYEKRSDEINVFPMPQASYGRINISLFVSNGYLVFTPDINYTSAGPGVSAYNSLVAAANFLSKKKWVDAKKMGLQGHSFGGYETNYLVTHSNLFAAACSAAGFGDLISWYLSDARTTYPMYWAEKSQGRLGATPWQNTNLYLANSPILKVNTVTTPMLLMNNKDDNIVLFSQGLEMFSALRRLGKKVWMLQYDGETHTINQGSVEAEDFHKRMMQFFDHYLKGKPAPVWMTRGIPGRMKGVVDGLEYDTEIKTPGPGLTEEIK
jgi:dienelactone hydrolase